MPLALVVERYLSRKSERSPFVREASLFQDLVIRCVRFAFANMPASVGKIFFSRNVALPFFNFRRLRHGFFRSTVHWEEVQKVLLSIHCVKLLSLSLQGHLSRSLAHTRSEPRAGHCRVLHAWFVILVLVADLEL